MLYELDRRTMGFVGAAHPKPDTCRRQGAVATPPRPILDGIFWILRRQDMPERCPPYQTFHRHFQKWADNGVFSDILEVTGLRPPQAGRPRPLRMLYRRHLCAVKKGGLCIGKKGIKVMAIADSAGLPVALHMASAPPHEVTLVEVTVENRLVDEVPRRLIGDKAYDGDPLDKKLKAEGIEMVAPHRSNRKRPKTQDGRALRRYKRQWKVERLFTWLFNFRRLVVRYEYYSENFLAFVMLGCIKILLRHF